jgi:hypothetical protein
LHPQARAEGYLAFNYTDAPLVAEAQAAQSSPADVLNRVPGTALAAAAGNIDVTRLLSLARRMDRDEATRRRAMPEIVWSLLDGTFQGIGPGFAGVLLEPPADSEFPLAALAAMQIQQRVGAEPPAGLKPADSLRSLLEAALALSPPRAGQPLPQLKTQTIGQLELLTLVDLADVPPGLSPSFAFIDRTMLFGTSADVVERAAATSPAQSLAASSQLRRLLGARLKNPTHVSYLHLAGLRRWLNLHGDRLAVVLSKDKEAATEKTRQGIQQLAHVLKLADHAAAAAQIEPTGIRLLATAALEPQD